MCSAIAAVWAFRSKVTRSGAVELWSCGGKSFRWLPTSPFAPSPIELFDSNCCCVVLCDADEDEDAEEDEDKALQLESASTELNSTRRRRRVVGCSNAGNLAPVADHTLHGNYDSDSYSDSALARHERIMSNTMAAAHEPTIHYLDSVLNEEEKRCEYGHQWRNFSISRSGRFRSKNKKRDAVDGKLFDAGSGSGSGSGLGTGTGTGTGSPRDSEKVRSHLGFIIVPVHPII
ncbi:hypothetical protein M5D96_002821 [Drosophila gunungcola]|uniref:Uncharacterized protein n=1 Tax=Drosophila gunungcola TaxID=103775 RepID=A0A9Q0BWP7_9MUSC|nr:hypothetical protein M5D96_002821 [Drosophila gunungcola]